MVSLTCFIRWLPTVEQQRLPNHLPRVPEACPIWYLLPSLIVAQVFSTSQYHFNGLKNEHVAGGDG